MFGPEIVVALDSEPSFVSCLQICGQTVAAICQPTSFIHSGVCPETLDVFQLKIVGQVHLIAWSYQTIVIISMAKAKTKATVKAFGGANTGQGKGSGGASDQNIRM